MSEVDLAYVAGFFDGEGCIHGRVIKKLKGSQRGFPRVWVSIGQKDPAILYWIQQVMGFGVVKSHTKSTTGRTVHTFIIKSTAQVNYFLSSVLPYLKGKKDQAKLGLELCSLILKHKVGVNLESTEWDYRVELVNRICILKGEKIVL